MKELTASQIRKAFIDFYVSKGHTHVPSSSLVPYNDPTLLFTNAGMVQFKDVFLGMDKRAYSRATTAQRCLRAGGKHNDLDTVGRTARHHTFFEMLGNFSFGDYFKRDAIAYAWEFLTTVLEMPKDRLYVTVFEEDDEAHALWQEVAGVSADRIFRIGAKDNFWAMGDTGPCGPCSEIFFDRGEQYGCDAPECGIGKCDCDRWMEIWNLVFMQFNRDKEGNMTPLPRPSIDTGMGLERVASIMQGKDSNYESDIMQQLITGISELCGQPYYADHRGFAFRVIADHVRACSFMITDGILPSNEGRGYVLRRILRRAARFGKTLGFDEPFLYKLFPYVEASLGDAYPEVVAAKENVVREIRMEEERFNVTLASGMVKVNEISEKMAAAGKTEFSGDDLFLLYDTYGFPLDLAKDIAEEKGFTVDEEGFKAALEAQRAKSRNAQKEGGLGDTNIVLGQLWSEHKAGKFLAYDALNASGEIVAIALDLQDANEAIIGTEGWLATSATPFYGESGGQTGDKGVICGPNGKAVVDDTQKLANGLIINHFTVTEGKLAVGETVTMQVNETLRRAAARNHSCTHLLHKALRTQLGEHLHQAGSMVSPQRLRFDFNYPTPLTAEQLKSIEDEVNSVILANLPIGCQEMGIDDAKKTGALAFFGDKYGDVVRVVSMGDYSVEFCGGTHCQATGDIGSVKIISEGGIGSGMRRIEAVTGAGALAAYRAQEEQLERISALLKSNRGDMEKRIENLLAELKAKDKEIEKLQAQLAQGNMGSIVSGATEINGIKVLTAQVEASDAAALRNMVDMLKEQLGEYALVVAAAFDDKVQFVTAASPAAVKAGIHSGRLIKEVAAVCGGGGGGRPEMAQAGGKDASKESITKALECGRSIIEGKLS
ncbi:MAG: alanine--tRNA ligase [Firmicutes bacterium]|nr:alanine--tRNA ligase [Bacillota bacterium]